MKEFIDLIGKKILCYRGYGNYRGYGKKLTPIEYILFDDKETFIHLTDQNNYDYHDFSECARHIAVIKDKVKWEELFSCQKVNESNFSDL